jgi:hemerythrin-like domain-containing protein
MTELIQEHLVGRNTAADLVKSATAYRNGDTLALPLIKQNLQKFVDFYPKHLEKEEEVFFPLSMIYFSESEQQSMLNEFWEFDRRMIHSKYKSVIESLEKQP